MYNANTKVSTMLDTLLARKGQIATITTERAVKVRKNELPITKTSTFQCRVGVDYENIKTIKEGRANGTMPMESAGLPWGTWAEFPYVIEHKGTYYFRCTRIRNNYIPKTMYTRNGNPISKEVAQQAALASEFKSGDDNEVFNIKVDSILDVA